MHLLLHGREVEAPTAKSSAELQPEPVPLTLVVTAELHLEEEAARTIRGVCTAPQRTRKLADRRRQGCWEQIRGGRGVV